MGYKSPGVVANRMSNYQGAVMTKKPLSIKETQRLLGAEKPVPASTVTLPVAPLISLIPNRKRRKRTKSKER